MTLNFPKSNAYDNIVVKYICAEQLIGKFSDFFEKKIL